jgi:hypothetical protein
MIIIRSKKQLAKYEKINEKAMDNRPTTLARMLAESFEEWKEEHKDEEMTPEEARKSFRLYYGF